MKCRFCVLFLLYCCRSFTQSQTCPVNINFGTGDLTHWYAYTGNNKNGYGANALIQLYDSNLTGPSGTRGVKSISEYQLNSTRGIQVITTGGVDIFGGFATIPTINGYGYSYSILLGSTAIRRGNGGNGSPNDGGGYVRGVSYRIRVPAGRATEPFTMTYAYAMVLENGTHTSSQQPKMSATLKTPGGVIDCASPSYYLPTLGNTTEGGRGATLDSAAAIRNGFKLSSHSSPNPTIDPNTPGDDSHDVWTKGWTEVTFDLAPYRGQDVSLTFEADNCIPGGHFAYGYIAIRNQCAGLMISGDSMVCNNSVVTYSVPALDGATYNWKIPDTWKLLSSDSGNIITVKSSNLNGSLSVREKNSCADLTDTIQINSLPSPEAGTLQGSSEVCEGINSSTLNLLHFSGQITHWISSTDSSNWTLIPNTSPQFVAENLETSTYYEAVVEKGTVCPPDSSTPARVVVDRKSVGGKLDPSTAELCAGQTAGQVLVLSGTLGSVQNWQSSTDGIYWLPFDPATAESTQRIAGITQSTSYRVIVKNGVCPADSSETASVRFNPVAYPAADIFPADTTICFGTAAMLHAEITTGTSYTWTPASASEAAFNLPFNFVNTVKPGITGNYVLHILNAGCPNALDDTFHVHVLAPVFVHAGNDTSVVINQSIQFHANSSDPGPNSFLWTPATALSDPFVSDPTALYGFDENTIRYVVKVTTAAGCTGEGGFTVKVYKTKPDIFVPNAFTPGQTANGIFRPIPVGIATLEYFRVFNRLGQLVFSTSTMGSGWNGLLDGNPQGAGAYVWMVRGQDFNGNIIVKTGTMVLIR